ncbi:hypothetical protein RE6C_06014 [Rhodopirellula europaea 6C]|uniref:Uncharacterized protein n=1 Tax=Rhodopirellula europaea 6C TaxID=1263867 RepID=M2ATG1_9BACT|nr:hypothetical protein RE6C_06014 [Rhodopirellula europaea 6C]
MTAALYHRHFQPDSPRSPSLITNVHSVVMNDLRPVLSIHARPFSRARKIRDDASPFARFDDLDFAGRAVHFRGHTAGTIQAERPVHRDGRPE